MGANYRKSYFYLKGWFYWEASFSQGRPLHPPKKKTHPKGTFCQPRRSAAFSVTLRQEDSEERRHLKKEGSFPSSEGKKKGRLFLITFGRRKLFPEERHVLRGERPILNRSTNQKDSPLYRKRSGRGALFWTPDRIVEGDGTKGRPPAAGQEGGGKSS